MSSTSKCPFGGCQGSLWIGLLAGAVLVYTHAGMLTSKSNKTVRAPGNKAWRMSKWIKHGGILRTQGLCGDFSKMPGSSMAQQTEECLANLDAILKEAGVERKNLLAITIYLADMNEFEEMNSVYDKWVDPAGLPTRLCVKAEIGHGAKLEIRAEAFYDE
jgi:enamine deaminase RidA (YjgF/YER057c/UK114 family)